MTVATPDPSLKVIRNLLARSMRANVDLHNVTKSMLKEGVRIEYRIAGRDYMGKVVEVIGTPGRTQVRVENVNTLKRRDIHLADITGIVQES